jgi:DNA-binding CsgD family transcriptional regulator
VKVLASLRGTPRPDGAPVLRALPEERVTRLGVEPLPVGAIHELVRDRLGTVLPRPVLARVHETSGGNPYFALELSRALGGAQLDAGDPLPLPVGLRDALSARLADLPAAAREALLVCSALTNPTEPLVAAALADGRRAALGLEAAAAARAVELTGNRVRFGHPLLASVCYSGASASRRRRLHRTLAEVVDDLEQRARHLALAADGPDESVARALDRGAELAWSRGAPEAAAELAEQALALTPSRNAGAAHERRLSAARYRFEAGDAARAVPLLEEALAENGDRAGQQSDRRAETLLQLGSVKAQTEGLSAGIELYRRALEATRDDAVLSRTHEALALAHADAFQLPHARPHAHAAIAAAERVGDSQLLVRGLAIAAWIETIGGSDAAEPLLARAVELETLEDAVWSPKPARMVRALRLLYTDRIDDARSALEELVAAAAALRAPAEQVFLSYLSLVERRAGRFGLALQRAEAAYTLAEQTGREWTKPLALHLEAQALAHLGRADDARRIAADVLVLAEETGQQYRLGLVDQGMLGFLELSLGDSRRAVEYLDPAAELLHDLGADEPAVFTFLPDAVEALVEEGRLDRAAELLDRLEAPARRLQRGWALLAAARCRGLLAAARGDVGAAEAAFAESLAIHEGLPSPRPFELARTLLAQGRSARRAKRRAAARDELTRALELFDEVGAALWAERAATELARIPGRTGGGEELTATERQVAELVALGHSNKEVAAKLFVTVRAVESNLTKIYGKLGVRSRTELASRLRATAGR